METCPETCLPSGSRRSLLRERAKFDMLKLTAPFRSRVMSNLKHIIKDSLTEDPDMWWWVKKIVSSSLEQIWIDVEYEFERQLESAVLRQDIRAKENARPASPIMHIWLQIRAQVLYVYLPHDKSVFGQMKDPKFWVIFVATLVPTHGVRVIVFSILLVMLLIPGPPDEYQLINYMLVFKGMQFITSGVLSTLMGSVCYYYCFSVWQSGAKECIDLNGPGADESLGQLPDYLGSVLLVWIAFLCLPYSTHVKKFYGAVPDMECTTGGQGRGLTLRLLYFDIASFFSSLLLLVVLNCVTCGWNFTDRTHYSQLMANVFWSKVLYSLLSLPFAAFEIPGMIALLTHSGSTGYNASGALVPFEVIADHHEPKVADFGYTKSLWLFNGLLRLAARGRKCRGLAVDGNMGMRDLARGAWERVKHGREPDAPPRFLESFGPAPLSYADRAAHSLGTKIRGMAAELRASSLANHLIPNNHSSLVQPTTCLQHMQHVVIESVKILENIETSDEGPVFVMDVFPDPEVGAHPWQVRRYYFDFFNLLKQLRLKRKEFALAPFPKRYWTALTPQRIKKRQQALEMWISCVLDDRRSRGEWEGPLRKFFGANREDERSGQEPFVQEVRKKACGATMSW